MHSGSGDPGQGSPDRSDPTQAAGGYPPTVDPAYAAPYTGQYPAAPTGQYWGQGYYGPGYGAPMTQPTEQLPSYWQPGSGYLPGQPPPPPPPPPKSPRWLWVAASAAALLVAGLVVALVVVSNSSRNSTVVAPASPPTSTPPPPPIGLPDRATTPALPFPIPLPTATVPTATVPVDPTTEAPVGPVPADSQTPEAVGTQTVVYNVTGEGRAINITYVDSGGVMQTEFNVALPWNKQVSLSAPAKDSASVAVVNVGRDVTCSVTVDGTQVRQRTGRGLTICSGIA